MNFPMFISVNRSSLIGDIINQHPGSAFWLYDILIYLYIYYNIYLEIYFINLVPNNYFYRIENLSFSSK